MLNMRMLEKCITACKEGEYLYFGIKSETVVKGIPRYSYTIYGHELLDDDFITGLKLLYNEDNLECSLMEDKTRICGFTFANTFEEIQKDLI